MTMKKIDPPRIPVTFNRDEVDYHDVLECPSCKEDYLHHTDVVVWSRTEEDQGGVRAIVDGNGHASISKLDANAFEWSKSRRNSLTMDFYCESCDAELRLRISQQKGRTFMEWEILSMKSP